MTKKIEKRDLWAKQATRDKEYGGRKFNKSIELARRVVQKYCSDDCKALLDETGLGNHPEIIRMFYRIGKAMTGDFKISTRKRTAKQMARLFAKEYLEGKTTP